MDALEATIHAVESGEISVKRVEDAMARQQRVKERFLGGRRPAPPGLDVVGRSEHQTVAAEHGPLAVTALSSPPRLRSGLIKFRPLRAGRPDRAGGPRQFFRA